MFGKLATRYLALAIAAGVSLAIAACSGGGSSSPSGNTGTGTGTSTGTGAVTGTRTATGTGTGTATTVNGQSATAVVTVSGTGTMGSTAVVGLSTADKISVVGSTTTAGKPLHIRSVTGLRMIDSLLGLTVALPSGWARTADYYTDPQFTYTQERGDTALDTPNEILCNIAQLEADKMVNRNQYRAQVDKNKCSKNRDSASQSSSGSGSQQGASNAPDYEDWTVISNRADANSPQVVATWVHTTMGGGGTQGGTKGVIYVKVTLAESPSPANPYGMFTMSFVGYPETKGVVDTTKEMMHGLLRTVKLADNTVVLQFYNLQNQMGSAGTVSFTFAAALSRAADGSSGSAQASFPNFDAAYSPSGFDPAKATNTIWRMGFDAATFARVPVVNGTADSTKLVCEDKVNKVKTAWRYGLYKDADGSRKTLNSGFPIRYVDATGNSHEGYVGYWGLWMNDNASVPSGSTVKRQRWSNKTSTEENYTFKQTKGRLIRHTAKETMLDKLKNVPMSYRDQATSTNYEVKWDGTKFAYTGKMGNAGKQQLASTDPVFLDVSALQSNTLFMWSQALGGRVIINLPVNGTTVTPIGGSATTITTSNGCKKSGGMDPVTNIWTNETFNCTAALTAPLLVPVTFLKDDVVMPDGKLADGPTIAVPPALTCYENCPDGARFTSTASGSVFYARPANMKNPAAHIYTWDGTNYLLMDGTTVIDLSTGSPAGSNANLTGDWGDLANGLNTGVLFDPAATDANGTTYATLLKCPWDANTICPGRAEQVLPVFFSWETGSRDWNVLSVLFGPTATSPDVAVKFDQPIDVNYTYPATATGVNQASADTKYAGALFRFQYGGFGDLWGIPGHCVDGETGAELADCMNTTKWVRYIPEFMIPDGEPVAEDGGNTYRVKSLEIEESMLGLPRSSCANTPLMDLALPAETDYVAPDIGAEPVVTDPPAVIGGVVQITL